MREIHDHKTNAANGQLTVMAVDGPGSGGANHLYEIRGFDTITNASDPFADRYGESAKHSTILFQNGPINEVGVNGVTHEALLAVLIDRLRSFQAGPYACRENTLALTKLEEALALTKLEEALMWLEHRTKGRLARGVEGSHAV